VTIAEDKDIFKKFYETVSAKLKLSIHQEAQNRSNPTKFLHFSIKSMAKQVLLKDKLPF
jgi:hypothetical protein